MMLSLFFRCFRLFFVRRLMMARGHHHADDEFDLLLLPSIFLLDIRAAAAAVSRFSSSSRNNCCGLEPSSINTSFSSEGEDDSHCSTTASERPIMAAVPTSRSNDWVVEMLLLFTICNDPFYYLLSYLLPCYYQDLPMRSLFFFISNVQFFVCVCEPCARFSSEGEEAKGRKECLQIVNR